MFLLSFSDAKKLKVERKKNMYGTPGRKTKPLSGHSKDQPYPKSQEAKENPSALGPLWTGPIWWYPNRKGQRACQRLQTIT